ncbi:hypothetical protein B4U79_11508 [Dinothrombium tinctorium]|uniref:Uncharacterized protein n=1 Tax=Dinothrombium tinctorium TaxID=1965070 RepID=A0A3S3P0R2_9ACAR|nr:hypothetical protein B4U79_12943 [Dinothrombium tinctorium]RWS09613.1 hypothetical protein B4U79_13514 [Dinothrombium tinctorium]RWS09733.1 hypothetical protein B4U79_15517 [Dinothrombium tinctorium]RWS09740.1 hypothetical protein B4U79_11508 [Dinothrombium tinctorium]
MPTVVKLSRAMKN